LLSVLIPSTNDNSPIFPGNSPFRAKALIELPLHCPGLKTGVIEYPGKVKGFSPQMEFS